MSIARHHTEWLSLVPVSGPFLSLPVLMEAFTAGLEPHDPDHVRLLRQEFTVWQEATESRRADPVRHQGWIRFVLSQTLDLDDRVLREGQSIAQTLQVEVPEHHELLRPSFVVADPQSGKPRLLIQSYPRSQDLSSYVAGSSWKASPDTRMTELLHGTGVRLGLVTNGDHWMLVDAPKGETSGYASWYASLWLDEPITLRAFRSLLSVQRFFGVPDDQTLESLLAKSASNQQEVTDQLGYQVRKAVEVLIHSLDKADQDFRRELLADVTPEQLYESALTVMMRLVFLFCAEERELIPSKPFPVYEQNYSVCTISRQLRELADQHGEELLERRYDAWQRLLAAFRAVYGGLQHNDIHIPAYGGSLFNPDRFPFLEGRKAGTKWRLEKASPLPVNNRTVLHLLEALQLLQIKVPGGGPAEARRVSFRALDIEQIGHVYEGLLDHTAKRATEPYLGLAGTRDKEPEIKLADLEKQQSRGDAEFLKYLKEETGKSESALKKLLKLEIEGLEASRFRTAANSDESLWRRIQPLAGLVRLDNFGYPVVIPQGSVFVTSGTDRRSSGTHYTPRSLTEPIVQYTLEPLVYIGPAEGLPKSDWKLKSAKELLALKICDMACGSGAFLVQATRYMAERLLEAWELARQANSETPYITPEGEPSAGGVKETLIPEDPTERKLYAMRLIAQRCIYGVDKNPLAVEMAKLSLWLLTMAKDKPFEFLDHSIRSGDSLIGLHSIDQLKHFSLKPDPNDKVLFKGPLDEAIEEAIALRLKLEDMPCNSVEDVKQQEELLAESNQKIARLRCAADLLVSAEFWGENARDKLQKVQYASLKSVDLFEKGDLEEFQALAAKERCGQSMFHWCLEFPEVIVRRGGFDAFVGNPPFLGGTRISTRLGKDYFDGIRNLWGSAGRADLCTYFFLRSHQLLSQRGFSGLLATNTISQGDTREMGLDQMYKSGSIVYRAEKSRQWPGVANLEVAIVWSSRSNWCGECISEGSPVQAITPFLTSIGETVGPPMRLAENSSLSFMGSYVMGGGFLLSPAEAGAMISSDESYRDVLYPYMSGEDVTSRPDQQPSRWVINFHDWPLDRASAPSSYNGPVAADYPLCLEILVNTVKEERLSKSADVAKSPWWQFWRIRADLYRTIQSLERVLFHSFTSKYVCFAFVPTGMIYGSPHIVLALDTVEAFGILQSSFHEAWAFNYCSTHETRLRYAASDLFETFPAPLGVYAGKAKEIAAVTAKYHALRSQLCRKHNEGLTATFNRFHDPDKTDDDIQKLRELHVEMDQAVAAAYGWSDLNLDHGFHETKQGIRFTISETARREVLQRLLKLNHERYAEEVKQGLHGKKGGAKKVAAKKKAASRPAKQEASLFDVEDDE
jgi:methylase of polypeptide subunit release factors